MTLFMLRFNPFTSPPSQNIYFAHGFNDNGQEPPTIKFDSAADNQTISSGSGSLVFHNIKALELSNRADLTVSINGGNMYLSSVNALSIPLNVTLTNGADLHLGADAALQTFLNPVTQHYTNVVENLFSGINSAAVVNKSQFHLEDTLTFNTTADLTIDASSGSDIYLYNDVIWDTNETRINTADSVEINQDASLTLETLDVLDIPQLTGTGSLILEGAIQQTLGAASDYDIGGLTGSPSFTGNVYFNAGDFAMYSANGSDANKVFATGSQYYGTGTLYLNGGYVDLDGSNLSNDFVVSHTYSAAEKYLFNTSSTKTNLSSLLFEESSAILLEDDSKDNFSSVLSIAADKTVSKYGDGTFQITNDLSDADGKLQITSGLLQLVGPNNAQGSEVNPFLKVLDQGLIEIKSGSALDLNGLDLAQAVWIEGTGILGSGALYNSSTTSASVINAPVLLGNVVDASTGGDGDLTIDALMCSVASACNTVSKIGDGDLTLKVEGPANSQLYNYTMIVKGGRLVLGADNSIPLTIESGASLDLAGYDLNIDVNVSGSGFNSLGAVTNSSQTLSVTQGLTLQGNASLGGSGAIQMLLTADTTAYLNGGGYVVTKVGTGEFTLATNTAPTVSAWVIDKGILTVGKNFNVPTSLTVNSGGAVNLTELIVNYDDWTFPISIAGTGVAGSGALFSTSTNSEMNYTFGTSSNPITLLADASINFAGRTTLKGKVTDNGNDFSLISSGTGDLYVDSTVDSDFSGGFTINGTKVYIKNATFGAGTITMLNDGLLDVDGTSLSNDVKISGDATLTNSGTSLDGMSAVTVSGTVVIDPGKTLTISGSGFVDGSVTEYGSLTLSGTVSGAGGVTVSGSGLRTRSLHSVVTFSGNNTYSGGTFIEHSGVKFGHDDALGTGAISFGSVNELFPHPYIDLNGYITSANFVLASKDGDRWPAAGDYSAPLINKSDTESIVSGQLTLAADSAVAGNIKFSGMVDTGDYTLS
ncbi:hypothetical protein N9K23_02410, partial [Planktomarina temperata]|nr:hypothetical protein [Planktomarina temperata]